MKNVSPTLYKTLPYREIEFLKFVNMKPSTILEMEFRLAKCGLVLVFISNCLLVSNCVFC